MQVAPGLWNFALTATTAAPTRGRRRSDVTPDTAVSEEARPSAPAHGLSLYLVSVLSGAAIAVAWWFPETIASALLGWVAALLLVFVVRARRSYRPAYVCGLVVSAMGFYWIYGTVSVYGGLGTVPSALIFALFVAVNAVQFLVFTFVYHNLGPRCDAWALRSPMALVVSEFITPRLFGWHYGHTQLALTPFVQVADLAGAPLVSFLMFWLAEAGVRAVVFRERRRVFLLPLIACGLALGYGFVRMHFFASPTGVKQDVVLVQGNTGLELRFDPDAPRLSLATYRALSRQAMRPGSLVVWPEGAIPMFLPADTRSVREVSVLPWVGDGVAFLVGSYAEDRAEKRYNAAFAVHPDGRVPPPYFKRVLIPFGESMPCASLFPWLKELNADAGILTAGTELQVLEYPLPRQNGTTTACKVAPLICYEDTVPALAREATQAGAELLVNLTYDTWFGRTAASYEHHLIATFRAIENRRFLVRASNSGVTAVVNPLGRTTARLPDFAPGALSAEVVLMNEQSLYTKYVGDKPWWALLVFSVGSLLPRRVRRGPARS
jgi:apolipoprotein N-acyltransferase